MIHSSNIIQSCSQKFLLFQERNSKNAALISKNLKHLGRRPYIWNLYLFSMILIQRTVFMHYTFQRPLTKYSNATEEVNTEWEKLKKENNSKYLATDLLLFWFCTSFDLAPLPSRHTTSRGRPLMVLLWSRRPGP